MLVRYIRDNMLQAGDRIPPQVQLREMFHCGVTTITSVIQELTREGMLSVRDKVGVFVQNPNASGIYGRTVGLVLNSPDRNSLVCAMKTFLELAFNEYDCQVLSFFADDRSDDKADTFTKFSEVPRLLYTVDNGEVDGLIFTVLPDKEIVDFCRSRNINVLSIMNYYPYPNNIDIDYAYIIRESVKRMQEKNIRNIAFFTCSALDYVQQLFEDSAAAIAGDGYKGWSCRFSPCDFPDGKKKSDYAEQIDRWVDEVVAGLYAKPAAERPGGLILLDDILALKFIFSLQQAGDYMPEIISMQNRDIGVPMPRFIVKNGYWDFDVRRFAAVIADTMMKMFYKEKDEIPFLAHKVKFIPACE